MIYKTGHIGTSKLLKNIFSLSVLQAFNYALPLLAIPYLVRVLGPDIYGLLAFATATVSYAALLVEYAFNTSATLHVSANKLNENKLSEIYSSVLIVKLMLMLISLIILIVMILSFERFNQCWSVYLASFLSVIGGALFPLWIFQGLEKFNFIVYSNIIIKLVSTVSIFCFVKDRSDYLLVPIFFGLGSLASGILAIVWVDRVYKIRISWQKISSIKFYFIDGWNIFVASISISLYTTSTIFFIGILSGNSAVGEFSAADKIIQAVKSLYQPFASAIYPHVGSVIRNNTVNGIKFLNKMALTVGSSMLFVSLALFIFADELVYFVIGRQFNDSIDLVKILSFLPLFVCLSNIYAVQGLYNFGMSSLVSKLVALSAFVHLTLIYPTVELYGNHGAAFLSVATEFLVLCLSLYAFKRVSNEKLY